jgi:hypothetical protein
VESEAGKVFYGRKITPWQNSFSKEEVILVLKRKKQNRQSVICPINHYGIIVAASRLPFRRRQEGTSQ